MTYFKQQLTKGIAGEKIVISKLRERGYKVKDFTNYSKYKVIQQRGVDARFLNKKTGFWDSFDVKANIQPSNLFFLEMYNRKGDLGWLYQSKSSWIFHFSRTTGQVYVYDLAKMRNWIEKKKSSLKIRQVKDGAYGVWINLNHPLVKEVK